MAETKMYGVRFLPALMVIALVCVAAAAGCWRSAARTWMPARPPCAA